MKYIARSGAPLAMRYVLPGALFLAAASTLILRFCASSKVSTIGDDSVSYLVLAAHFAGRSGVTAPWVGYEAHFGPLFPLVLAAAGADQDFARAHLVVAFFAIASLPLLFAYARMRLSGAAAIGVVATFFAMATFWTSIRGILSESLYLCITLGALIAYERWRGSPGWRSGLILGSLVGLAYLARSAAITLVAAFVICEAARLMKRQGAVGTAAIPLAAAIAFAAAWALLKPKSLGFTYLSQVNAIVHDLAADPVGYLSTCAGLSWRAWVRTFVAGPAASWMAEAVFACVGLLGMLQAVRRALAWRVDGWYVVLAVLLVFIWRFPDDNGRRLLYPIVPLILINAAEAIRSLRWTALPVKAARALQAAAPALVILLCAPPWLVLQMRATHATPLAPNSSYALRDMTEYYLSLSDSAATKAAAKEATVLSGLERIASVVPPAARVIWVVPDYVALIGKRPAVAWNFGWTQRQYLEKVEEGAADYLVISSLKKADLRGYVGAEPVDYAHAKAFATTEYLERNPVTGEYEFALMKIDHDEVRRLLVMPSS